MAESDFWVTEQVKVARDLVLSQEGFVVVAVGDDLLGDDELPAVGANLVLVDV